MKDRPFFAISLPAETIAAVLHLGAGYVAAARLPDLTELGRAGAPPYIALHVANTPPDLDLLREHSIRRGFEVVEAMGCSSDGHTPVATWRLSPLVLRNDKPKGGWPIYMRPPVGCIVAVVRLLGEQPASERWGWPRWFVDSPAPLPRPVRIETNNFPVGRPWEVLGDDATAVRRGWGEWKRAVDAAAAEAEAKSASTQKPQAKSA